ncbi:MAG: glycosyltransferase family 4 protein [Candidatus Delongbacteria bacterium]
MRILYVNSTRRWGGVKSWCLRSARSLQQRGHELWVAGRTGDPFLDACRDADLSILPLAFGMSWSPLLILRLHGLIRRLGIEVTVCNTGRDLSTAGVASRLAGVPVVHRVGSGSDFPDSWVRRRTHHLLGTRLLAPAQVVRDELLTNYSWLRPEDVAVSWNGALAPARPALPGPADRLVCLSRLAAGKGLEPLLQAVDQLQRAGRVLQLDLVGEGPLEAELKSRSRELGLDESVRFPGFVRPAAGVLSLAGIGVLPSLREGFPNTLLEYWAAGLAVVASDLPGVREALDGSGAALLVPPGDPGALAQALGRLLDDDGLRRETAAAGQARLAERFTSVREAERLEAFYQGLIAERHP